jgi:hypothetical protein
MRLPGSKIWRAFPELDRFNDAQCAAFVRASRRVGLFWTVFGWAMNFVGAAAGLGIGIGIIWLVTKLAGDWLHVQQDSLAIATAIVAIVLAAGSSLLSGLMVRDWQLRRRIAWAINDRGRCIECRYSLLGLPVDQNLKVICPECGFATEVDPSLGELSSDGPQPLFQAKAIMSARPPFWTPKRGQIAGAVVLGLAMIAALWWAGTTWVRRARAQRVLNLATVTLTQTQQDLNALPVTSIAPRAINPLALAALRRSVASIKAIDAAIPPVRDSSGMIQTVEFRSASVFGFETESDGAKDYRLRALTMLDMYDAARVWDPPLAVISDGSSSVGESEAGATGPQLSRNDEAELLELDIRVRAAAWVAAERGKLGQCVQLLEVSALVEGVMGPARRAKNPLNSAADTLSRTAYPAIVGASAPELDALERALARPIARPVQYTQRQELRLRARLGVAQYFGNEDVATWGQRSAIFRAQYVGRWGDDSAHLGTLEENLAQLERAFARLETAWQTLPFEREYAGNSSIQLWLIGSPSSVILYAPLMNHLRAIMDFDATTARLRGIKVMIELERFKLRTGAYPMSLDELTKAGVSLPSDPYTGKTFLYRPVQPERDSSGRPYILWSTGPDCIDDGGRPSQNLGFGGATGDEIINPNWK